MDKKFRILLAILQITSAILAILVFVKNIRAEGRISMTIISFLIILFGSINGIKNIREINR